MTKRLLTAAVLTAALAGSGCTDLPDVDAEGCGNLVVNVDEDCDGFSDQGDDTACGAPETTNACFFVCDDQAGVVCPDGWGCGADGRCRRPSGTFEPVAGSPYRFRVGDYEIGDVDGDGFNDVIGNDVQTVTARFGSETGELASEVDVLTREPQGPLSFGLFDDDALLDVLVPIAGGLFVLLGDEERTLEPVAYSPFEVQVPSGGARIFPVESDGGANLNSELLIIAGDAMAFINNQTQDYTLPAGCPAGQCTISDIAGRVPVANIDESAVVAQPEEQGRSEFALAFRGATTVWVYTSAGSPEPPATIVPEQYAAVGLPAGTKVDQGAYFADINGDGELDLMVSVRNATNRPKVVVALNDGAGGFAPALVRQVYDRGDGGDATWPIAVGNLAGDAKADYVFPDFIAIADLGVPVAEGSVGIPLALVPTSFITNQTWTEAAIGEFNGDGLADVSTVIEGRDGVDVFLNAGNSGVFNKFHVDTDDPPRNLRVADFDGDFILDVAFAESGFGSKPDVVSVVFGNTSGGPSAPVKMGEMGFVEVMEPVSSVVSIDSIDAIADLFTLTSSFPDRETTAVALLQGSSSRRMLSPFTLQPEEDSDADIPRRALFGNFSPNPDGVRDIVCIADAAIDFDDGSAGGNDPIDTTSHLWFVPGTDGTGQLDAGGAAFVDLPDTTSFDTECAVWTSGDLDGEDPDEIVGIDNSADCFGFGFSPAPRVLAGTVGSGEPFDTAVDEPSVTGRAVSQVELLDLDGDGDNDLLALFEGETRAGNTGGDGPIDGAAVTVLWNQDGELSYSGASEITFDNGARLFDVDAIRIDDSGVPALAILASGGVFVSKLDPETTQYGDPTRLVPQFGDGRLEVGDMNADGLDDITYTVGDDVHVLLGKSGTTIGAQLSEPPPEEDGSEGGDQ